MQRKKILIIILLVKIGSDVGTALQFGASGGSELVVKYLLEANADINPQCEGNFGGVRHPRD